MVQQLFARHLLLIFVLLYFLLSIDAMLVFLKGADYGGQLGYHSFHTMLDGTANRPVVYRALLPMLLNALIALMPVGLVDTLNAFSLWLRDSEVNNLIMQAYRKETPPSLLEDGYLYETLLFLLATWACMLGYVLALYKLGQHFYPTSRALALFTPITALLAMLSFHRNFAYPYDYAMLFLNATWLLCLARGHMRAQMVVFALACLNKETAIYLVFLFAIHQFGRMDRRALIGQVLAQIALYGAITVGLRLYFGNDHLSDGLFSSTDGQLQNLVRGIYFDGYITYLCCFFLLTYQWPHKPLMLRQGLFLLPLLAAVFFWLGFPYEYRQFLDVMPYAALLATHTLVVGTGIAQNPLFEPLKKEPHHG